MTTSRYCKSNERTVNQLAAAAIVGSVLVPDRKLYYTHFALPAGPPPIASSLLTPPPNLERDLGIIRRLEKKQPATATSEVPATLGAGDGLQQSREVPLARNGRHDGI